MSKHAKIPYPVPVPCADAALQGRPEVVKAFPALTPGKTIPVRWLSDPDLGQQIDTVVDHYIETHGVILSELSQLRVEVSELTSLCAMIVTRYLPPAGLAALLGPLCAERLTTLREALSALMDVANVQTLQLVLFADAVSADAAQGHTERRKRRRGGQASGATRRARSPRDLYRTMAQTIWQRAPTLSRLAVAKLIARTLNTTTEQTIRRAISDLRPTP